MKCVVFRHYRDKYDESSVSREDLGIYKCVGLSLASVILLFGGLYSPVFVVCTFALHVSMLLFLTEKDMFSQMAFLLPFAQIYKLGSISTSLYTVLIFILIAVLAFKRETIRCTTLFSVLILLIYMMLQFSCELLSVLKLCAFLLLFLLFTERSSPDYLKRITLLFTFGLILSSIMGLFKDSLPLIKYYLSNVDSLYIGGVLHYRFTGLVSDPNYYSAGNIICISALSILYLKKELGNEYWLLFLALSVFGFITYSKSYAVFYSLQFLAFIFVMLKTARQLE